MCRSGPIYGPGPVAETFPEPLTELEHDLWVPPLRDAVREAVLLAGAATQGRDRGERGRRRRWTATSPSTSGWPGRSDPRTACSRSSTRFRPRTASRGAWRVGRLRAALPRLAEHLLDRVDADLEAVPALAELTSRQLIALLHRSHAVLRALHAHEILMGMLTDTGRNRMTGASVALRVLVEARQDGLTDDEVLERSPIVLALDRARGSRPRPSCPPEASAIHLGRDEDNANDNGILREALRLRVRWVQELSGRAAWELGERLTALGELTEPELIRHMTLEHVEAVATKRAVVIPALVATHHHEFGAPLPGGVPALRPRQGRSACRWRPRSAAAPARAAASAPGPVTYDAENPPAGSVLVTTTLSPGLAPLLTRLSGIVAETGSVLSHLAILAREAGVATVVGYAGAMDDLPEGAVVRVDGETGQVTRAGGGRA